jgi:hypothetical protein
MAPCTDRDAGEIPDDAILEAVGRTPHQIEQGLLDVFTQETSAVLTNVVGPNEPIYLAGSKTAGVVPWVSAAGTIGMGINIFSYNGGVTVSLQVDPGLIPDPDTIIADYERELEALRRLAPAAATGRPRAGSTGRYTHHPVAAPSKLRSLQPREPPPTATIGEIERRDRLGGLIHEYYRAAA